MLILRVILFATLVAHSFCFADFSEFVNPYSCTSTISSENHFLIIEQKKHLNWIELNIKNYKNSYNWIDEEEPISFETYTFSNKNPENYKNKPLTVPAIWNGHPTFITYTLAEGILHQTFSGSDLFFDFICKPIPMEFDSNSTQGQDEEQNEDYPLLDQDGNILNPDFFKKTLKNKTKKQKNQNSFLCRFKKCNYHTKNAEDFSAHRTQHTKNLHQCTFLNCPYSSTVKSKIKRHQLIHGKERPYQCEKCEFTSVDRSNLIAHMHTHTGAKPYPCRFCERKFSQSCNRKAHEKRLHSNLIDAPNDKEELSTQE